MSDKEAFKSDYQAFLEQQEREKLRWAGLSTLGGSLASDSFVEVELSWKDFLKTSADLGLSSNLSCPPVGTTLIEMDGSRWRHIGEGRWEPTAVDPGIPIMPSASDAFEEGLTLEKLDEAIKLSKEWPYSSHGAYKGVTLKDTGSMDWPDCFGFEFGPESQSIKIKGGEMQVFEAIVIDRIMEEGKETVEIVMNLRMCPAESMEQLELRLVAEMGESWKDSCEVQIRPFLGSRW